MSNLRKAITLYDEDMAMTLLKPISSEYNNYLIVIYEDAYGEMTAKLTPIITLRKNFSGGDEEFDEILKNLDL